jgi:hypothetical protein
MKRSLIAGLVGTLFSIAFASIDIASAELRYFLHVRTHDGSSAGYNYTSDSYAFNPALNTNLTSLKIAVTSKAAGTERFDLELNARSRWNNLLLTPGRYSSEYVDSGDTSLYLNSIAINLGARNCLANEKTFDDVTIRRFDVDYRTLRQVKYAHIDFSKGCGTARGQRARTFTIGSLYVYDLESTTPAGQFQVDISEITPSNTLARQFYSDRLPSHDFLVQASKRPYDLHFDVQTATTPNSDDYNRLITVTSLQNNQPIEVTEGSSEHLEGITPPGAGLQVAAPYRYSCPAGSLITRVKVTSLTKDTRIPDIFPDFFLIQNARIEVTRHCVDETLTAPGSVLGSRPPTLLSFMVAYLADVPESWIQLKYDLTNSTEELTSLKTSLAQLSTDYGSVVDQIRAMRDARDEAQTKARVAEEKLTEATRATNRLKNSVTSTANTARTQLRSISKSFCGSRSSCKQAVTRVINLLSSIGS